MQKIDEEKEKLTGRDDPAMGEVKKEKKKKKGKHKKKHHKKKDEDSKDKVEVKENKKSTLSNDQFIINGNYNLIKMLGFGAFGEIHLAYDTNTKMLRAIKFEIASHKNPQLKHEHSIIEQLNKPDNNNQIPPDGIPGIPRVYLFDRMENKYNYMVMDFLGPSLSDLFQFKEKSFSLETVLMIGIQMLTRIEYIHEKGFIHRDIKPENFVIGLNEKSNIVHIIDFGLSKRYKDKNTGQHIPYRENRHLVGTVRYASINAHLGVEQSRRDDIESIGYVLVYFFLGRLPWQSKLDKGKPPVNKIMEKKLITPPEILCKKMPMEFSYYFHYCKNLKFEDRPDYTTLKCLFADLLASRIKIENEFIFDWFDENNANRKEVKGIDRNIANEMKEKSEKEELSARENENNEENNNDPYVTPGGDDEQKKNEPISLFGNTKTGNEEPNNNNLSMDSSPKKVDNNYAETFLKNVGKEGESKDEKEEDDKIPKHDGEVIQLKVTGKNYNDKDSVSESDSENTEKLEKEKDKEKVSKKSSDSNYGILKSSGSEKEKPADVSNANKDDVALDVNQ